MDHFASAGVAAVIAAAGMSRRMGTPKQLLPWAESTVLATVIDNLDRAGASPILCVLGHQRAQISAALRGSAAQILENPDYAAGEMLRSYQIGVAQLLSQAPIIGTLLALGDQPQIDAATIALILNAAEQHPTQIIIPSYQMRRGHPLYLPRRLWPALLDLGADATLRAILNHAGEEIFYVNVNSDSILRDLDTPVDYAALRPPSESTHSSTTLTTL